MRPSTDENPTYSSSLAIRSPLRNQWCRGVIYTSAAIDHNAQRLFDALFVGICGTCCLRTSHSESGSVFDRCACSN